LYLWTAAFISHLMISYHDFFFLGGFSCIFYCNFILVSGDVSIYASWNWRKLDFNEDHQCHRILEL
jgi:hypothetical protein